MRREKRSIIDKARLTELRIPGIVYVITCGVEGCPCNGKDDSCGRGFFSLFLQAVYGIYFSDRLGIAYHIDFGNITYCYTDDQLSDRNFWNYYFNQPLSEIINRKLTRNKFIELYPLKIWDRNHFRELHNKVIKSLSFTEHLKSHLQSVNHQFKNKRVLGVQIRGTDHADEVPPISLKKFIRIINKYLPCYDKLFVATDEFKTLQNLKELYGEKIIFNHVSRSTNTIAVHLNPSLQNRMSLGIDVILDCYCLSRCSKAILIHSNVSYAALLFNPELPYTLLERPTALVKRLKTLLLYNLNKWGIRKW